MFDMTPGEDLTLIQNRVRHFATKVLRERHREFEEGHAVSETLLTEFASLGLAGTRGDHLIEKLPRDLRAMDIVEGTGQVQRVVVACKLAGLPHN